MRATGIVRRVDHLGRVVIPREIRKSLGIREGTPLEIFLTGEDGITFQRYEINHASDLCLVAENLTDTYEGDEANALAQEIIALANKVEKFKKSLDNDGWM